jgi:V-type H+-transporting ATPase subunit D
VELLIELASLQTAFLTLDEAIKTTNRRVNALDNVVRPKLENTISYIKVWVFAAWHGLSHA